MLSDDVEAYVTLRRSLGYKVDHHARVLRAFARHAAQLGLSHVRADVAIAWIHQCPSPGQRHVHLRMLRNFALHVRPENPLHEVPPDGVFPFRPQRPTPFIYTSSQIARLIDEGTRRYGPTFGTFLGLIAVTGMRGSEARALHIDDITIHGLIVRNTKFRKSRLLPLHKTTQAVLDRYLVLRQAMVARTDRLFISARGTPLTKSGVHKKFSCLRRHAGLVQPPGKRNPRIHDLRHTFAVRALERASFDRNNVTEHILALSTYMGHCLPSDTYWYLEATPELMRRISERCEAHIWEGRP